LIVQKRVVQFPWVWWFLWFSLPWFLILFHCGLLGCKELFQLFVLLRFALWHRMWFILEKVLCIAEKNVQSAAIEWNTLSMSFKSILSMVDIFVKCLSWCSVYWWQCIGWDFPLLLYLDLSVHLSSEVLVLWTWGHFKLVISSYCIVPFISM
jgi:hypothetical protein